MFASEEVEKKHLIAAAAAYIAVHVKGQVSVKLQDDTVSLGDQQKDPCLVSAICRIYNLSFFHRVL